MFVHQSDVSIQSLAQEQANFCSVFRNPTRVLILWALMEQELSVGAIAATVGSSLQNISQHLSLMKACNIVSSRRAGHTIYYRLDEDALSNHCLGLFRTKYPEVAITIHPK